MAKKLFIGGLSLNTTEQDLKRTFSQYGLIDDIKIVTGHSGLNKNLTQKKLTRLSKSQFKNYSNTRIISHLTGILIIFSP